MEISGFLPSKAKAKQLCPLPRSRQIPTLPIAAHDPWQGRAGVRAWSWVQGCPESTETQSGPAFRPQPRCVQSAGRGFEAPPRKQRPGQVLPSLESELHLDAGRCPGGECNILGSSGPVQRSRCLASTAPKLGWLNLTLFFQQSVGTAVQRKLVCIRSFSPASSVLWVLIPAMFWQLFLPFLCWEKPKSPPRPVRSGESRGLAYLMERWKGDCRWNSAMEEEALPCMGAR